MPFRAGAMGAKTDTGMPGAFAGSLAALMESKLHAIMTVENGTAPFPMNDNSPDARARRALFVAIAQAVLEHLEDNDASGFSTSSDGGSSHTHTITVHTS